MYKQIINNSIIIPLFLIYGCQSTPVKPKKLKGKKVDATKSIGTIYFQKGSKTIPSHESPDIHKTVREFKLNQDSYDRILIEAHSDATGSEEYNSKLAYLRGMSVKKSLVSHGIGPKQIIVKSYGENRPFIKVKNEQNNQMNRRAHLKLVDFKSYKEQNRQIFSEIPIGSPVQL